MSDLFALRLAGAVARRRGKVLIGPVDLELSGDGTAVVIGPNGAGKTSLLALLHGTLRLSGGSVSWACGLEAARAAQAFVFQTPVMMRRRVWENIAYPLRVRGVGKAEARRRAEEMAARVGLGEMAARSALALSGGERQKLALARALVIEPRLLFLDEPCAALDGRSTREIEAILADAKAAGTRLILSTHNLGQARRLADEVLFLLGGRLLEHAPAPGFFDAPATAQARAFLKGDIVE